MVALNRKQVTCVRDNVSVSSINQYPVTFPVPTQLPYCLGKAMNDSPPAADAAVTQQRTC